MRFKWRGVNSKGLYTTGEQEAQSLAVAKNILTQQGITPLSLHRKHTFSWLGPRIKVQEINDFTLQLATLLQANIPILEALMLVRDKSGGCLQKVLPILIQHIQNGERLSESLQKFPKHFNTIYCALVAAGENTGNLNALLKLLVAHQQRLCLIKNKISKALFYPITVFIAAVSISIGLLLFIVPQFKTLYANFSATLPLYTRALIQLANFLQHHGGKLCLSLLAITFALRYLLQHWRFLNRQKDRCLLKLPIVGKLIQTAAIARWSQLLATTTQAQLPILEALKAAGASVDNQVLQQTLKIVSAKVCAGETLHQALQTNAYFPSSVSHMLAIGEKSAQLSTMLGYIADHYQTQLDRTLDNLSKLIEPVIMMLLAVMIGGVVIAMYLPIFKISTAIS